MRFIVDLIAGHGNVHDTGHRRGSRSPDLHYRGDMFQGLRLRMHFNKSAFFHYKCDSLPAASLYLMPFVFEK